MNLLLTGVVLAQLAHLAPSGYAGTLTVADRAEVRVRTQSPDSAALDADDALALRLQLDGRRSSYYLTYGPRVSYFDFTNRREFTLFHAGGIGAQWTGQRLTVGAGIDASVGGINSANLVIPLNAATVQSPGQPMADPMAPRPPAPVANNVNTIVLYTPNQNIYYIGSLSGRVNVNYTFSREWSVGVNGFAGLAGGFDFPSQAFAPPNRFAGAGLGFSYRVSPRDALTTAVNGTWNQVLQTPSLAGAVVGRLGGEFYTLALTETLTHVFSVRTQGSIGLGASYLNSPRGLEDTTNRGSVAATGQASITRQVPAGWRVRLNLTASAGVNTAYNAFIGAVQRQAFFSLSAEAARDPWSAVLSTSANATLPTDDPTATRTLFSSLTFGYRLNLLLQAQTGVRVVNQLFPAQIGGDIPPQWVYFVGLAGALRPLRF